MCDVSDVSYKHVRDIDGNPVATIAMNGAGDFSVAICSKRDQFTKSIGRKIAHDRLALERPGKVNTVPVVNRNVAVGKMYDEYFNFMEYFTLPLPVVIALEITALKNKQDVHDVIESYALTMLEELGMSEVNTNEE